ncbi:MAG: DUF58 domain-containing protein [Gammaproteobacteria bacterium]|nr:DUF58 domain-containing protein [Gammaproteobacteria bacterium]
MSVRRFIAPEVWVRLKSLSLRARRGGEGLGFGLHASKSRGAGLEFAQYRAYEPGDEPRQLDWKLYARSDRYFVREAERDSPLRLQILLDGTASMAQADAGRPEFSKFEAGKALCLCLAELAQHRGDGFAVTAVSGGGLSGLPTGTGPRHRDRLEHALGAWTCGGGWPGPAVLRPLWEQVPAHALLIVISDGFEPAVVELAERWAAARREVLFIQLLSVEERDFSLKGSLVLRDPETGEEKTVAAEAVREDYLRRFGAAQTALAARLAARGIPFASHVLDEPLDGPLWPLFGREARA